jgi:hypothetical protein
MSGYHKRSITKGKYGEIKGYELGSYGIRKYKNLFQWVYGTGCAEPRLSIVEKL